MIRVCCCMLVIGLVTAAEPTAVVDDAGYIRVAGERQLPLGLRIIDGDGARYGATLIEDVHRIGDAGFDCLQVALDFTRDQPSTAETVHNAAIDHGLHLIVEPPLTYLELAADFHSRRPAVLASLLADGPNRGIDGPGSVARQSDVAVRALRQRLHGTAPQHLAMVTLSADPGDRVEGYAAAADLVAFRLDPLADARHNPRYALERQQDLLSHRLQPGAAHLVELPVLPTADAAWPAPADLRAQAWLALVQQARGLIWSGYSDGDRVLPDQRPDLWAELVRLVSEIKQARPAMLAARPRLLHADPDPAFSDGSGTWHACWWVDQPTSLLVVVNCNREAALTVDLRAPDAAATTLRPLFDTDRYARGLQLTAGRVVGSIEPGMVACYRLD